MSHGNIVKHAMVPGVTMIILAPVRLCEMGFYGKNRVKLGNKM